VKHADWAGQPQERHHDQGVSESKHQGIGEHVSDDLSKRRGEQPVTLEMSRKGRAKCLPGEEETT
jgi:hypothetical protein